MPIDAAPGVVPEYRLAITNARILRLAFGTALSLWFSQAVGWSVSYIAPIITLLLLATPMPRPKPKFLLVVVLALAVSIFGSFVFLPFVLHQMLVGFLLVALALFHSFYFSARGGAAVVGTLVTVGIAITVAIGTVSVDALLGVAAGLMVGAIVGVLFAYVSHLLVPDPEETLAQQTAAAEKPKPEVIPLAVARRNAMRSLAIVLPITFWFLISAASASNIGGYDQSFCDGPGGGKSKSRRCSQIVNYVDVDRWGRGSNRLANSKNLAILDAIYFADCPGGFDFRLAYLRRSRTP